MDYLNHLFHHDGAFCSCSLEWESDDEPFSSDSEYPTLSSQAPKNPKNSSAHINTIFSMCNIFNTKFNDGNQLYINLPMNGSPTEFLLDSGAQVCICSADIFWALPNATDIPSHIAEKHVLHDHQGKEIPQLFEFPKTLQFTIAGKSYTHPVCVTNNGQTGIALLGLCFLKAFHLSLVNQGDHYNIFVGPITAPSAIIPTSLQPTRLANTLFPTQHHSLKPGEIRDIQCATQIDLGIQNRHIGEGIATTMIQEGPLLVHTNLIDLWTKTTSVMIQNVSSDTQLIPQNQPIARFHSKEIDSSEHSLTIEDEDETLLPKGLIIHEAPLRYDVKADIENNCTIPPHIKEPLLQFIQQQCPKLIPKHDYDIGLLQIDGKVIEMDIILDSTEPITSKPYRLNGIRAQQLDKALEQLTEHGILSVGDSPYSSPAFLIEKKASDKGDISTLRLTLDYRKLNHHSFKDHTPLGDVDEMINRLQGQRWYSSIDLQKAYFNLALSPEARKKAAIITTSKVYLPNRLMFGLSNGPSRFSMAMNRVLSQFKEFVLWYLDDILIFSNSSEEDHFQKIQLVLMRLQDCGLKINLKGTFFQNQITFLGKIINAEGMRPLKRHIIAVQQFPPIQSFKDLMRFLGLLAWVKKFLRNYAQDTEPLCKILREKTFEWTPLAQAAFERLKASLSERTFLYHFRQGDNCYLITDCSDTHFGGICYQIDSYSVHDYEALKKIKDDPNALPSSVLKGEAPILMPTKKGCPQPFPLQANPILRQIKLLSDFHSEKEYPHWMTQTLNVITKQETQTTHRQIKLPPDLDEITGETDRTHVVRVVSFISGFFRGPALRFTILEKEASCLLKALDEIKPFMEASSQTFVISDSQAFTWILKFGKNYGLTRIERLAMRLSNYRFKIIVSHTAGKHNWADALTRSTIWKTQNKLTHAQAKFAFLIKPSFPLGQIITIEDIITDIEQNPHNLHIPTVDEARHKKIEWLQQNKTSTQTQSKPTIVSRVTVASFKYDFESRMKLPEIAQQQRNDRNFTDILAKLHELGPGSEFRQFTLHKGLLYYKKQDRLLLVVPTLLIPLVLSYYHSSNHCGAKTLTNLVKMDYYIKNLRDLCNRLTTSCCICAAYKTKTNPNEILGTTPIPLTKASVWHLDLVTGLPKVDGKDGYLSIIDPLTSFKIAIPISKTVTAKTLIELFHAHVLMIFGIPERLSSDKGRNLLVSQEFRTYARMYGIILHTTTPNISISHGLIEASNKQVTDVLLMLHYQYKTIKWPSLLPLVCFKVNCRIRPHQTKFTPYQLMFGQTQIMKPPRELKSEFEMLEKEIDKMLQRITQEIHKQNIKKGGAITQYEPGQLVYLKDFSRYPGMVQKWSRKYILYPFKVLHDYGQSVLVTSFNGTIRLCHKNNLKKCHIREEKLYSSLPKEWKETLGFPFTEEEYQHMIDKQIIPDFYKTPIAEFEKRQTRQQTATDKETLHHEAQQLQLAPTHTYTPNAYLDSDSASESDSSQEAHDDNEAPTKKVTFLNLLQVV